MTDALLAATVVLIGMVYSDEIAAPAPAPDDAPDDADLPAGRLTVSAAQIQVLARGQRGDGLLQRGYVL